MSDVSSLDGPCGFWLLSLALESFTDRSERAHRWKGEKMAKDLVVSVEDRPGKLADLGEALGKAGVNIQGVSGIADEGKGHIHVLVENAKDARTALEKAGFH